MEVKIASDWKEILREEFEKPYFAELTGFVRQEYASRRVFPRGSNIFRAFDKCPFEKLKVVVIGQDPYHGEGQANGLCFSVGDGVPFPPSLQNIFKEVADDTDAVVREIAVRKQGLVYMLWGSYAQRKGAIADPQRNLILKAVHPSPLSVYRGFFGCRHFSKANDYLRSIGKEPIVW